MTELITIVLGTIAGLLPIANPFSTAVVFLSLTNNRSSAETEKVARMTCIYMTGILLVFLIAGVLIMNFFGISLPGVRIAGGLIITGIGFGMMRPGKEEKSSEAEDTDENAQEIAFTPLAMPMLSGPGSIAVTIGMATETTKILDYIAITIGIVLVAVISYVVLHYSTTIVRFLGKTGMNALNRIMGFILICVGIQFIVNGVYGFFLDEEYARPIFEMYRNLAR